jgi:hypothetical protein
MWEHIANDMKALYSTICTHSEARRTSVSFFSDVSVGRPQRSSLLDCYMICMEPTCWMLLADGSCTGSAAHLSIIYTSRGKLLHIHSFQLIIISMMIFCLMCNLSADGFLYVAGTKYNYS